MTMDEGVRALLSVRRTGLLAELRAIEKALGCISDPECEEDRIRAVMPLASASLVELVRDLPEEPEPIVPPEPKATRPKVVTPKGAIPSAPKAKPVNWWRPKPKAVDQSAIDQFIAEKGVTQLPPAAALPTSASIPEGAQKQIKAYHDDRRAKFDAASLTQKAKFS